MSSSESQSLEEFDESTHDLIPGIDAFVWQSDASLTHFYFVSGHVKDLFHYPIEQWTNEVGFWAKHIDPDHYLEVLNDIKAAPLRQNRIQFEHRAFARDGSLVWLKSSVHLIRDRDGKIEQLHGLSINVTVYKRIELQFEKSLKELEDIKRALDQTTVVAITDPSGVITYANDHFCRLYGYSREEILGKTHRMFNSGFHPPEFFKDLWKTITRGKIWKGEIKNKAKDGTEYWAYMTIVPFLDAQGKPYQYVSIRADITPIKKAEEQRIELIQSHERLHRAEEAIEIRDQFVSMAAHELKTPLTSLQIRLELLARELNRNISRAIETEKVIPLVEASIQQMKRLTRLVNDMLDVSRIAAKKLRLNLERVNLTDLLHNLLVQFEEDLKVAECEIQIDSDDSVSGMWDKGRIEQVLINLMTNAMKYGRGKPIEFKVYSKPHWAVISVSDHGIGIPENFKKNLFKRFERTEAAKSFQGAGLGLWIVKKIVEAHGGNVLVESQVGRGSIFTVELPTGLESNS